MIKFLRFQGGSPVNLTNTVADLTNTVMLLATFGENGKTKEHLLTILESLKDAGKIVSIADFFPSFKFIQYFTSIAMSRLRRLHSEADRMLEDTIHEHKANTKNDDGEVDNFLDVLLDMQKKGNLKIPFTNDCIKASIVELFTAGSHTSSILIEWAMSELMRNPKTMKKAQEEVRRVFGENGNVEESRIQELNYLKLVIKETFRLRPPASLITRESRERTKVDGYDIFPKTTIMINIWAMGRDSNVWIEPEKFYPERFEDSKIDYKGANKELIPFGAGKRICPGISLATTYVELVLANLLYHFDWKFPNRITPENLDMAEVFQGAALSRKHDLNLIPIPFDPFPKN